MRVKKKNRRQQLSFIILDLLWEGTVLLLAISFAIMFVQLGVEGITTPLAYRLFRWKSFENSIYYSGFGLIVSLFVLGF